MSAALAVHGGPAVCRAEWPAWPQYDEKTVAAVTDAVRSGRWTVSGPWTGRETYEREFARRFAEWVGVPYCVSTDHGATSLMIALEALGVGDGDEVLVPVLTWVATATAVLNVGAIPVLVDVDPDSGCVSPEALAAGISGRTRAIMVVHLHCRMADMDAVGALAAAAGLPIVEDCAQAHGARWNGAAAGSLGAIGAFSMQQGKVLTAGEGGAVVTRDPQLADRLQQLRSDGRRYRDGEPPLGHPYLVEIGDVMGNNCHLSELPAALLLDQLDRVEAQVERRAAAAAFLDAELGRLPGLRPLARPPQLERPSVFAYAVRRAPGAFAGRATDIVCGALEAEIGARVGRPDRPLHENVLYRPHTKPRYRRQGDGLLAPGPFPAAEELRETLILLPQRLLLAERSALEQLVEAFAKVLARAEEL